MDNQIPESRPQPASPYRPAAMRFAGVPRGRDLLRPVNSVGEFVKLRFRISSGLPSDVLKEMGGVPVNLASAELIPAAERGVIDGVEWINPSNDIKVGLQDVFKFYSIQGLHQAIDIADVIINMGKWKALTPDLQAIVQTALTASLFEAILYFQHENASRTGGAQEEGCHGLRRSSGLRAGIHQERKEGVGHARAEGPVLQEGPRFAARIREAHGALYARDFQALDADLRRSRAVVAAGDVGAADSAWVVRGDPNGGSNPG